MLGMVRRRGKLIALVTLAGTGLAGIVAYHRQPTYTAEALVVLEPNESRIVDVEAVAAGIGDDVTVAETQIQLIKSPVFLGQLADRLGELERDPAHVREPADSLLNSIFATIPKSWLIATGMAVEAQPSVGGLEAEQRLRRERQIAGIHSALRVEQVGRSLVVSIEYTAKHPVEAAETVNTLADFYIEGQLSDKLMVTKQATGWLEVRLAELRRELEASEQAIERYRDNNPVLQSKVLQIDGQQVADLTNMLVETRAIRIEKEARLRYIRGLEAKGEGLESITEVLQSPFLSNLWEQESELQLRETDLRSSFGDKHPRLQALIGEKSNISNKINLELRRLVDNIANEISVLGAKETSIQSDIGQLMERLDVGRQAEIELRELERQVEVDRRLYQDFLQRYKETKEQQEIVQANAKIVSRAKEPAEPSSLSPALVLLAGFLGSSMMGAGLAWLTEQLDQGVRSGKEVESEFGLLCLGLVPLLKRRQHPFGRPHRYLLAKPLSAYAEAIRSVHTAMRLSAGDQAPKAIQVTSSVPGEGKTVFAVSLATSLAHAGHRTLLLDLDLRHPGVQREISVPSHVTLGNYVSRALVHGNLVYHDEESELDVIAGRYPEHNAPAILASERLRDLLQQLRLRYDYIVVDSTPVLGVSDSKVTSRLVDAVLFIVRWEDTTFETVRDALKELFELKATVSGAVISQVNLGRHKLYGYGGIDDHYKKYSKYYIE